MTVEQSNEIIENAHIRPTSVRILVYKAISEIDDTFCLTDLEQRLPTVDKSSIFRALTVFHEHRLIHAIDDGSGSVKYCQCHNLGHCRQEELHAHFHCETCNKTFCIDSFKLPDVQLPPRCHNQRGELCD